MKTKEEKAAEKERKKEHKARAKQLIADVPMLFKSKYTGASLIAANQLPQDEPVEAVFYGEKDGTNSLLIATDQKVYIFGAGLKGMVDERIPYERISGVTAEANLKGTHLKIRDSSYEVTVGKSTCKKVNEVAEVIRSHIK